MNELKGFWPLLREYLSKRTLNVSMLHHALQDTGYEEDTNADSLNGRRSLSVLPQGFCSLPSRTTKKNVSKTTIFLKMVTLSPNEYKVNTITNFLKGNNCDHNDRKCSQMNNFINVNISTVGTEAIKKYFIEVKSFQKTFTRKNATANANRKLKSGFGALLMCPFLR